jgi:hypothetical protein
MAEPDTVSHHSRIVRIPALRSQTGRVSEKGYNAKRDWGVSNKRMFAILFIKKYMFNRETKPLITNYLTVFTSPISSIFSTPVSVAS